MEITFNYLLIIFLILLAVCVIQGLRKGVIKIVFGLISWVFLIWFINIATPIINQEIYLNTEIAENINETITLHLQERYDKSEEKEQGSGLENITSVLPSSLTEKIDESIQNSVNEVIYVIADELTATALKGISILIAFIIGSIIIFIIGKILEAIGRLPGLKSVNKLIGCLAGVVEALLIIWFVMFIADCFPATTLGGFVINNSENDELLSIIYSNNLIENIIGLK